MPWTSEKHSAQNQEPGGAESPFGSRNGNHKEGGRTTWIRSGSLLRAAFSAGL